MAFTEYTIAGFVTTPQQPEPYSQRAHEGPVERRKGIHTVPKFIDHHVNLPPTPPAVAQQMAQAIKAGKADQFGVKMVNLYMGGGQSFCHTEAPNADAVIKSHAANGIPQTRDHVFEVQSLV